MLYGVVVVRTIRFKNIKQNSLNLIVLTPYNNYKTLKYDKASANQYFSLFLGIFYLCLYFLFSLEIKI